MKLPVVQDKRIDRDFLIAEEIIPRTSKWDYTKSKGFCTEREKKITTLKRELQNEKKQTFTAEVIQALKKRICKELLN